MGYLKFSCFIFLIFSGLVQSFSIEVVEVGHIKQYEGAVIPILIRNNASGDRYYNIEIDSDLTVSPEETTILIPEGSVGFVDVWATSTGLGTFDFDVTVIELATSSVRYSIQDITVDALPNLGFMVGYVSQATIETYQGQTIELSFNVKNNEDEDVDDAFLILELPAGWSPAALSFSLGPEERKLVTISVEVPEDATVMDYLIPVLLSAGGISTRGYVKLDVGSSAEAILGLSGIFDIQTPNIVSVEQFTGGTIPLTVRNYHNDTKSYDIVVYSNLTVNPSSNTVFVESGSSRLVEFGVFSQIPGDYLTTIQVKDRDTSKAKTLSLVVTVEENVPIAFVSHPTSVSAFQGDDLNLDFTVKNNGNEYVDSVSAILDVPSSWTASSEVFSLAPGEQKAISLQVQIPQDASIGGYVIPAYLGSTYGSQRQDITMDVRSSTATVGRITIDSSYIVKNRDIDRKLNNFEVHLHISNTQTLRFENLRLDVENLPVGWSVTKPDSISIGPFEDKEVVVTVVPPELLEASYDISFKLKTVGGQLFSYETVQLAILGDDLGLPSQVGGVVSGITGFVTSNVEAISGSLNIDTGLFTGGIVFVLLLFAIFLYFRRRASRGRFSEKDRVIARLYAALKKSKEEHRPDVEVRAEKLIEKSRKKEGEPGGSELYNSVNGVSTFGSG